MMTYSTKGLIVLKFWSNPKFSHAFLEKTAFELRFSVEALMMICAELTTKVQ